MPRLQPLCACGCGEIIVNMYRGKPRQYINGHQRRGRKMSPESRLKIAIFMRGEGNPFYGKKHTQETIDKMASREVSQETRDKISASRKGKSLSPEHRAAIAKAGIGKHPTEETRIKLKASKSKENHPRWCGMRRKTTSGYIEIRMPEHPNANEFGFILEHRLVVEKRIGRYLTKEEIVHHINEIKSDNRDSNLLLTNNSEHSRLHRIKENKQYGKTRNVWRSSDKIRNVSKSKFYRAS